MRIHRRGYKVQSHNRVQPPTEKHIDDYILCVVYCSRSGGRVNETRTAQMYVFESIDYEYLVRLVVSEQLVPREAIRAAAISTYEQVNRFLVHNPYSLVSLAERKAAIRVSLVVENDHILSTVGIEGLEQHETY